MINDTEVIKTTEAKVGDIILCSGLTLVIVKLYHRDTGDALKGVQVNADCLIAASPFGIDDYYGRGQTMQIGGNNFASWTRRK